MLGNRLSAWFGADHPGAVIKDVLSGKERILPLARRYPCRTLSACHFAGLNFVRVGFRHVPRTRGSLLASPSMVRWLNLITDHRVLEVCVWVNLGTGACSDRLAGGC